MFIYHFNRLICNKFLWGAFAVLIAFAFVFSDVNCVNENFARSSGTINGKKVLAKTLEEVEYGIRGFGRSRDSMMSNVQVERSAWEQIAARMTIEGDGLGATTDEMIAFLRSRPEFQENGNFNMARYRMVVREMGLNPEAYERFLRHQLAIMKGYQLVETATWIPPMELDDEVASLTDRFTVRIADFKNEFIGKDMKLKDEDYKKYFEANTNAFALPDRLSVRYAVISASNYLDSVKISDDELRDYYDANLSSYTKTVSNKTVNLTFEEARSKILDVLKWEEAVYCAQTAVTFTVYSDIDNTNENAMVKLSKTMKVPLQTTALFAAGARLSFCGADSKVFTETAFDLDPERNDTRYGIAKGNKSIYVMERASFEAAHVPAYDKVAADVKRAAIADAREKAFKKAGEAVLKRLRKSVADGKKFADAAVAESMTVSTQIVYTVNDIAKVSFPNSFSVAYGSMKVPAGSISDAIMTSGGNSIFVFVEKREPGEALSAEMMVPQIRASLERRDGNLFGDWLKENLSKQDFKPARPLEDESEDTDSEDDTVSE